MFSEPFTCQGYLRKKSTHANKFSSAAKTHQNPPASLNLKPYTLNLEAKHETQNLKPYTLNLESKH